MTKTMVLAMPMTLTQTAPHVQRHRASPCTKFVHLAQRACQSGELPEILSENIKFKSIVVSSARQGHLDEGSYDPDAIGALGSPHVHNGRVETILHSALSRKSIIKRTENIHFHIHLRTSLPLFVCCVSSNDMRRKKPWSWMIKFFSFDLKFSQFACRKYVPFRCLYSDIRG